jgi:hypothetical protein
MSKVLLIAHKDPEMRRKLALAAHAARIERDEIVEVDTPERPEAAVAGLVEDIRRAREGGAPLPPLALAVVQMRLAGDTDTNPGLNLIRRLRAAFPSCAIIGLTTGNPGIGRQAIRAGANDFVGTLEFEGLQDRTRADDEPDADHEVWCRHISRRLELWRGVNDPLLVEGA